MDLNSILNTLASGSNASEIAKQFNLDTDKVTQVINNALPNLIGAMQKNASSENGAASLSKALTSHLGDTSLNLSSESLSDGGKILGHILGDKSNSTFSALAKKTGASDSQVSGILSSIAPMLLGLIGKGKDNSNTGIGGLGGMLGGLLGGDSSSSGGLGGILGGAMSDKNNNGVPDIIEGFMK